MKKDHFSRIFTCCMLLTLSIAPKAAIASSEIFNYSSVRLSGHVPSKAVSEAVFLKGLDSPTFVPVTFVLPLRNQEALEALIQRLYDPTDEEHYGKYLTPEEFAEQFSPTQEDYDQVMAYAKSLGLTISGTHSNRTLLNVSGPAESIEKAFNLHLQQYQKADGRIFYAPDNDPEVLRPIASIIRGVVGLDNHAVWHTYNRPKKTTEVILASDTGSNTFPSGPGGGYAPKDIVTAYNLTHMATNGTNQTIALFELGSYLASDLQEYTQYFGLPTAKIQNILVDGGSTSGIDPEVILDIELALAIAPKSHILVYEGPNSGQGVLDTYNRIATDNRAKQVSTSWGLGEGFSNTQSLQAENAIFQQMAAQGQTIYAAAGDSGAYDDGSQTLMVDDPASQPYVVGVGGTRLIVNSTNGAYSNETVWNDGPGDAGGGGVSTVWPIPSWQKNVSTVYSKTNRNVPDVTLNADPDTGYSIYYNGQWTIYGGTSCAAPLWAAFTARVNQKRVENKKSVLGFANPFFYAIGLGSSYNADFHDITTGNNLYYSAGTGYDNASGWGSFNGANLLHNLASVTSSLSSSQRSPLLNLAMTCTAPFKKGGTGTYEIVISNHGNSSTSDMLTLVITLPTGLTCKSLRGSGWKFDKKTLTCKHSSILEAGSSYPPIKLVVNVDRDAPNSVTPTIAVSGG